ncbi:MAG: DUF1810 domain-containing protein [Novosphingobium sp.]|nr:DUF1810 domain-containing protein [Novosphingobium sp.]
MSAMDAKLADFVAAQDAVYDRVRHELAAGRKRSHWMWFIFPQLAGLGHSAMSRRYALASREEARQYWEHPVLGPRLKECIQLVLGCDQADVHQIFGSPDDLKFRSCLTLFAQAVPEEPLFQTALERFYGGQSDPRTLALVNKAGASAS